jgi:hypothetical protein
MKTKVNKPDGTIKSSRSFFSKQNASGFFAVQPKLTVGQPNDKYEQEADRVAEQVVDGASREQSFFAPATSPNLQSRPLVETISPLAQMQSEEEEEAQPKLEIQCQEEEEMMQMQPLEEEEEMLQPKANHGAKLPNSIEPLLKMNQANGSSLNNKTRGKMEQSFGADFSDVKIHTDNAAVQMNKELGAQAFTSGNDIYFNKGKYDPGSQNGNKLLAHELTHTVQQSLNKGSSGKYSAVQCALTDEYSIIRSNLSYGIFDWVIRDAEAEEVLDILIGLSDQDIIDTYYRLEADGIWNRFIANVPVNRQSDVVALTGRINNLTTITALTTSDHDFIRDVCEFFFPGNPPSCVNNEVANIALRMVVEAKSSCSRLMDLIPRPPSNPSLFWLLRQVAGPIWRSIRRNGRIYVACRNTVARNFRSAYEVAQISCETSSSRGVR